MPNPKRLSKSKYISGLQCPRLLWWQIHEPGAEELKPGAATQALFDQGHRVGALACEQIPGGVLIDVPYSAGARRLSETRKALDAGCDIIYEAALEHDGVIAIADILHRNGRGWTLTEVKQSTKVKPEHLPDLALQTWVLRGVGLDVQRMELMHINRQCRFPDLSNLFVRNDCTRNVERAVRGVPDRVATMKRLLDGALPDAGPGDHCDQPYECAFKNRCWASVPEHSLWSLYRLRSERRADLFARGIATIQDLRDGAGLTVIQERQRRAVTQGSLLVESGLGRALAAVEYPIVYLDFETIWPAIPVWNGMRPYDHAAVQVSVHIEDRDGSLRHHEWLAEGPDDPRLEMARRVVEFCEGDGRVVAYNAGFESRCLQSLMDAAPAHERDLARIDGRLWDLLPVVRNHVYHPDFHGSFSIKSVLPALVPDEPGYEGSVIKAGDVASAMLDRLLLDPGRFTEEEHHTIRADLLAYCKMDTLAMVKLMTRLRELV